MFENVPRRNEPEPLSRRLCDKGQLVHGSELPEQTIGIERLREDEEENRKVAEKGGRDAMDVFVRESCRMALIRLETSANRTTLKKRQI